MGGGGRTSYRGSSDSKRVSAPPADVGQHCACLGRAAGCRYSIQHPPWTAFAAGHFLPCPLARRHPGLHFSDTAGATRAEAGRKHASGQERAPLGKGKINTEDSDLLGCEGGGMARARENSRTNIQRKGNVSGGRGFGNWPVSFDLSIKIFIRIDFYFVFKGSLRTHCVCLTPLKPNMKRATETLHAKTMK